MPHDLNSINGVLDIIAQTLGEALDFSSEENRITGMEEVFSVYNVGRGKFDETAKFINLRLDMFDFNGKWAGFQSGVHISHTPSAKLIEAPASPLGSFAEPPVPRETVTEWTKGLFTFADGSTIIAQGPALTHLVPMKDESFLFMVTTAQVITQGTGVFEGVHGVKQGTGTTHVGPGLLQSGKFPSPGFEFEARFIDTFRLIRGGFQNSPAVSGSKGAKK